MSKKTTGRMGKNNRERIPARHPGPRPVDIKLLREYAEIWRLQLLLLRDGRPGTIVSLDRGERRIAKVEILHASDKVKGLLSKLTNLREGPENLWFQSPVFPEPQIWNQLKDARSTAEMQKALDTLERYMRKRWNPPDDMFLQRRPRWADTLWSKLLFAARERASDLLKAKELPHYPKAKNTERPSSDNKRIDFFAKVLAGLALRREPGTATKRLSHWNPPVFSARLTKGKAKMMKGH